MSQSHQHMVCQLKMTFYVGVNKNLQCGVSKSDMLLYVWSCNSNNATFILQYIDDLVVHGEHLAAIKKVMFLLATKLEMKDMDELHGIEIIHEPCGILQLSQHH